MSSTFASSPLPMTLPCTSSMRNKSTTLYLRNNLSAKDGSLFRGERVFPSMKMAKAAKGASLLSKSFKSKICCSVAQPETLEVVQEIIAKQLSLEQSAVIPQTKFSDLGADSLDTVEIMMALEEKFGVSIGEGGAEGISTVQDAADLIEKVKASSAS
ncbi:acyl carrier protein 1 [Cucumis melo var. makuwa]|uniref:Acyl carrier protein n=1 Tax=Cucumis melo var. makuwa TaxID=1194695 RepID=A0A5A7UWB3_CUCMM|nr:acyl carrier protein 1 [Cucumis melo var. makuwa]TYK03952.1 acyl carrier protein 1 [Cucumis melo var. makuwa]